MSEHHTPAGRLVDRVMILAAAALFSTGGAAVKACTALSAWQVAGFRSGIAALAMVLFLPSARRGWRPRTWLVGVAYAATMILYVSANKTTTAANTIFLQGTAPLYVLLLSPWLLAERIRARDLLFMASLATGMALFFVSVQPASTTAPAPMTGNLLGALAGFSWGLTIMGLRWLGRDAAGQAGAAAAVTCGNLLACAACMPWAVPVHGASAVDWTVVSYLGVFQVAAAYVFLTRGIARLSAFETSLLLLVEPVLNPVWAWLVHGELPGLWAILGGAIILGATAAKTVGSRKNRFTD